MQGLKWLKCYYRAALLFNPTAPGFILSTLALANSLIMLSRRDFISKSALTAGFFSLASFKSLLAHEQFRRIEKYTPEELATDEDFWKWVRGSFNLSHDKIYLNSAGLNPQPESVVNALIKNYHYSNEAPTYTMWRVLDKDREPLRASLAGMAGCSAEEIVINRNSTEGLNTIIFGIDLKPGDEVVLSKYDYPNMMNAWKQREVRDGIKLVWIDNLDFPIENDQQIVDTYAKAITTKTKIVHITHLINWVGQILPVCRIADMAHQKGCEVIVDGAQSFAHIEFKIPELGCDYFATSLHKWLGAPFGSGMLYIKKEKISKIWPLLSAPEPSSADIRKFEDLGSRSFASEMAISNAIDFHKVIGGARKEARLRYLKDYWCNKVKGHEKFKLYTSMNPAYACSLATFGVDGWKGTDVGSRLFYEKNIVSTSMDYENIVGTRISPNVFTTLDELDILVQGIEELFNLPPGPYKK